MSRVASSPAPLYDLDAEVSVLGSIIIDSAAIAKVLRVLDPEDFYRETHGQVYRAALELHADGDPIDNVTLGAQLESMGLLERIGGRAELASMQGSVPTTANVEHYSKIVRRLAVKRRKAAQAREVVRVYDDPGLDPAIADPLIARLASPVSINGSRPHSPVEQLGSVFAAATLLALDLPAPRWAVPGLLPEGLSVLASRPKRGKSWMVLGWGVAVATAGFVLGKLAVQQGDVLYLALEDSPRRLQARLQTLLGHDNAPSGLFLATTWPRLDEGGYERLRAWLDEHPDARLIVVDTWARVRPRAKRDEDRYAKDYQDAGQLKALADEFSVAVVVLHNTRKMAADDWLDTLSGTLGLAAAADAILGLFGNRGEREAPLKVTGRDLAESELLLAFDGTLGTWTLVGDGSLASLSDERRQIVDLLRTAGPLAPTQIASRLGRNASTTRTLMGKLRTDGFVAKEGDIYRVVVGKQGPVADDLLADFDFGIQP